MTPFTTQRVVLLRSVMVALLLHGCGSVELTFASESKFHQSTPIGRKALCIDPLVDHDPDWIQKNRFDWRGALRWYSTEYYSDPQALAVCDAIESGDLDKLDRLLTGGVDVNQPGRYGMTFLLYSVFLNERSMVHLIGKGANADAAVSLDWPDERTCPGVAPGITAAFLIAGCGSAEELALLLNHGEDPNRVNPYSEIPLIWTVDTPDKLRILLKHGADINQISAKGTPNPVLAKYEDPEMILCFLQNGFDYLSEDELGTSLLDAAVHNRDAWRQEDGWKEIVRFLEDDAGVDLVGLHDLHPSEVGKQAQLADFVPAEKDRAQDYFTEPKQIALIRAIEAHDLATIDRLIALGVDVNSTGVGGVTPLIWATGTSIETFEKLLQLGADPNRTLTKAFRWKGHIGRGETVLFWAVRCGTAEHVRLVMEHGGDPNVLKPYTQLPALFEVFHGNDDDREEAGRALDAQEKIRLLAFGSEPCEELNRQDARGRTALMLAHLQRRPELLFPLLIAKADLRKIEREKHFDIMLFVIHEKRLRWRTLQNNEGVVAPKHQAQFAIDYGALIAWVEALGGDFEAAEATVFGPGLGLEPIIDLGKRGSSERPWLPPIKRASGGNRTQSVVPTPADRG